MLAKRLLYWSPRILGIIFAAFISLFTLDVFGEGYSAAQTISALAMHLIPTAIILVMLVIAWRWERLGALLFLLLAVGYIASLQGRFHWSVYVVIAGPLLLIGGLFLCDSLLRSAQQRAA
jgi:hypothetical protein